MSASLRLLRTPLVAVLMCPLLIGHGASAATSTASNPSFPPATVAAINHAVSKFLAKSKAPGAVVGIWIPGRGTYLSAKGLANNATGEPMQVADHFRIGSITKPFTLTVLLQLAAQGRLRLDDPVSKYLKFVPNGNAITLRMLGNMTAGLFSYTDDPKFTKAVEDDPRHVWTPQELLRYGLPRAPYFKPGKGFHYSNTNTVLLGLVIEKVTKRSIGAVYHQYSFAPLHLGNTVWPTTNAMPAPYAHGITKKLNGTIVDAAAWSPSQAFTAGQLVSTAADLAVWAKACAIGEQIPRALQRERLRWVRFPPLTRQVSYGLGIVYNHGWLGHDGGIPGYTSSAYYLPSRNATIVVLANSDVAVTKTGPLTPALFRALAQIVTPTNVPI